MRHTVIKHKNKFVISSMIVLLIVSSIGGYFLARRFTRSLEYTKIKNTFITSPTPELTTFPNLKLPTSKILPNDYQVFETFNNCGPASLSMALSFYGIYKTQEELGQQLRPYQNPQGDNDDKSVSLFEMGRLAETYGLVAYHQPNGTIEILKQFIANGFPVIPQTLLHETDDIGHFRVIKGYDDAKQEIIQDDSFQGHNIHFSYDTFTKIWKPYANEYLVLVPKNKVGLAKQILGENFDEKHAWERTVASLQNMLQQNPNDTTTLLNLSVAYYNIGDYKKSVGAFEKVENKLPFRTLWYNTEPIQAYYMLGKYDRVFAITDKNLNNGNRAYSELYIIRGNIYKKQGDKEKAKAEFEKAVFYNKNLPEAKQALASVE